MKKKQTQHNLSNLQCDTSTTLPTAPLNLRFSYRSTLKLSAFEFHLNAQEFQADVPLPKFNCYDACYNTNMATDISLCTWRDYTSDFKDLRGISQYAGNSSRLLLPMILVRNQKINMLCGETDKITFGRIK